MTYSAQYQYPPREMRHAELANFLRICMAEPISARGETSTHMDHLPLPVPWRLELTNETRLMNENTIAKMKLRVAALLQSTNELPRGCSDVQCESQGDQLGCDTLPSSFVDSTPRCIASYDTHHFCSHGTGAGCAPTARCCQKVSDTDRKVLSITVGEVRYRLGNCKQPSNHDSSSIPF